MPHVVLLGDSVFDNAAYVGGGPDVVRQVHEALGPGGEATLLAVDGHVAGDVGRQLRRLPPGATHLAVSAGGNDALGYLSILARPTRDVGEALEVLAASAAAFERTYGAMLDAVRATGLPAAVCTIYHPRFPDARLQRQAVAGLAHFNDALLRQAFRFGVAVVDLRTICDEADDYANPIEPSSKGGLKIARTLARLVREHRGVPARATVFAAP